MRRLSQKVVQPEAPSYTDELRRGAESEAEAYAIQAEKRELRELPDIGATTDPINIDVELMKLRSYLKNRPGYGRRKNKKVSCVDSTIEREMKTVRFTVKRFGLSFTPEWVDMIRDAWEEDGRQPSTIKSYLHVIENFFHANGYDIDIAMPEPTKRKDPSRWLKKEEAMRMLEASKDSLRDRAMMSALWYGALRSKEDINLRCSDIRFDKAGNAYFMVKDHGQGLKDKCERRVDIPDECVIDIKRWLTLREKEGFNQIDYPILFFNLNTGEKIGYHRFYHIIQFYGHKAGIDKKTATPHAFRRGRCSYLLNEANPTVPPTQVQAFMGHSSLEITLSYSLNNEDTIGRNIRNAG